VRDDDHHHARRGGVARRRWDWTRPAILALFVPLLLLDLSFVASNLAVKISTAVGSL